jgi:hypothetical protein
MLKVGGKTYTFFLVLVKHPILAITLLIMPFSDSPLLSQNIAGVSGLKPLNLLILGMIMSWLWKGGGHCRDRLESKAILIFITYCSLFTFAFLRTLIDFDMLNVRFPGELPNSIIGFILSFWVKGLLIVFSFIYILQLIRSRSQVLGLTCILLLSFTCFSVFSLFISYGVNTDDFFRLELTSVFINSLGLHYNSVGTIIMIGVPLTLGFSLQYGKKYIPIFVIMSFAMFYAGSRGAIMGGFVGCSFAAYMCLGGKFSKLLKPLAIVAGAILVSNGLVSFLSQGETGLTFNQLSSGRLESMWLPLLTELIHSPVKLIFGMGLFGMIMSDSYTSVFGFFKASHAHNAYLNLLMDGGIIYVALLISLIKTYLKIAINIDRVQPIPLYFGLIGSIIAYLIAGVFGREFLPSSDNMMLFPVLALLLNYYRLRKQELLVE